MFGQTLPVTSSACCKTASRWFTNRRWSRSVIRFPFHLENSDVNNLHQFQSEIVDDSGHGPKWLKPNIWINDT
jgi:hypothetical protein